jgi:hypothetical protein
MEVAELQKKFKEKEKKLYRFLDGSLLYLFLKYKGDRIARIDKNTLACP